MLVHDFRIRSIRELTINLLWKSDRRRSCNVSAICKKKGHDVAYVDELLATLLVCPPSLVLENDIIVPSSLQVEVLRVEEGVASGNVDFSLFFLLCRLFAFLDWC